MQKIATNCGALDLHFHCFRNILKLIFRHINVLMLLILLHQLHLCRILKTPSNSYSVSELLVNRSELLVHSHSARQKAVLNLSTTYLQDKSISGHIFYHLACHLSHAINFYKFLIP